MIVPPWKPLALVPLVAVALAACGGGGGEEAAETGEAPREETTAAEAEAGGGGTLVFGTSADPVVLDGPLVTDGESTRVISQIFEGLVTLEAGGTEVVPDLAERWEASEDGTDWTFHLRDGVTFHDGEPFDAEAVCFNFDRWYTFTGSFQNPSATLYWQTIFGGFENTVGKETAPESLQTSLYESCEVVDERTVVLHLTKPSAAFLTALSIPAFSIASPKALEQYGADEGEVDDEGVFHPAGTYGTEHPTGTGPFRFGEWQRGDHLTIVRNDDYWGEPAGLERIIFRPIADNAARLQALQTGEIQGYDLVEPQDVETIEADPNLQTLERPAFNIAFIGMTQSHEPLDRLAVRQAIAHAIDKQQVVDSFYAGRGETADQFLPPAMFGHAEEVAQYELDPERSQALLREAGLEPPVEITFCYPTDVSRPYMPDPARNYQAFAAQLNAAGFQVEPRAAPWSPDYLGLIIEGQCPLYLLGLTPEYPDPDAIFGVMWQRPSELWGFQNQELFDLLDEAETEADQERRTELYEEASRMLMDFLPGVPYARSRPALAFRVGVEGFVPSPVALDDFSTIELAAG